MAPAHPLRERIAPLLENLFYPSESDEPVEFFSLPRTGQGEIAVREFAESLGLEATEDVKEKAPELFWSPVVVEQAWYGDEERERTGRFVELRKILAENLAHLQYFEAGEIEVGLYLVGQSDQCLIGIKTTAVRT